MLPLASRIPASMASLLRSDSSKPLRNSSNCCEHTNTLLQNFHNLAAIDKAISKGDSYSKLSIEESSIIWLK